MDRIILGAFSALALAGAVVALTGCSAPARAARVPVEGVPHLRVMTYNVNYGIPGEASTIGAIAAQEADLVLLQETTAAWEAAIERELRADYPYMEFHHCCGAGGLAVLSKRPIRAREILDPPEGGWFPAMRLELESPVGVIQVLSVHLRPQLSESGSVVSGYFSTPPIRRAEIEAHAKALDLSHPTLVVGDFNEGEGGGAIGLLEARGFRTVLPEFHPDATTWRWTTSVGEVTTMLDHIMYDPRLKPLQARVLKAGRSDHLPVVAIFERSEP